MLELIFILYLSDNKSQWTAFQIFIHSAPAVF